MCHRCGDLSRSYTQRESFLSDQIKIQWFLATFTISIIYHFTPCHKCTEVIHTNAQCMHMFKIFKIFSLNTTLSIWAIIIGYKEQEPCLSLGSRTYLYIKISQQKEKKPEHFRMWPSAMDPEVLIPSLSNSLVSICFWSCLLPEN